MTLTTREMALVVWSAVFFAWALSKRGVRQSLGGIFRAAVHWKILVPAIVVVAYSAAIVSGLHWVGLWGWDLLKDTILWLVFSGLALAFSGVQLNSDVPTWRRVLTDQLKAVVLVEYIVNVYTFPLWVELVLAPTLVFVGMVDAFARLDPKYKSVAQLTGFLLAVFGFAVLGFAVRQAIAAGPFSTPSALRDVLLAPVLSLALLPLVHVFFLISAYEQLFLMLSIGPKKDPGVVRYAKRRLAWHLGIRPAAVREFLRRHRTGLRLATTKSEVDMLFQLGAESESERPGT